MTLQAQSLDKLREEYNAMKEDRDNINSQLLESSRELDEKDQQLHNLFNIPKEEKAVGNSRNTTSNNFYQESPDEQATVASNFGHLGSKFTPAKIPEEGSRRGSRREKGTGSSMHVTSTSGFKEKLSSKKSGVINHNNHAVKDSSEGPSKKTSANAKRSGNIGYDGLPHEITNTPNGEISERSKSPSLPRRISKQNSATGTPKLKAHQSMKLKSRSSVRSQNPYVINELPDQHYFQVDDRIRELELKLQERSEEMRSI